MPGDDFAAFILTHGRPDRVDTFETLKTFGYTGKVFLVVDDEDKTLPKYRARFGSRVLTFSKADIAARFDQGDNFDDRRAIFYARNACFDLAEQVGVREFIQLDDDYTGFYFKFDEERRFCSKRATCLDDILDALLAYFRKTGALSVCMAQGGDHLGGAGGSYGRDVRTLRKAMNTFICSTERRFSFVGRINEDVNTYTSLGRRGELFLTILQLSMIQRQTQSNPGGMTELYRDSGTYVKSFYSILYSPSCVKVTEMRSAERRIHHKVRWGNSAAKIVHERYRKAA